MPARNVKSGARKKATANRPASQPWFTASRTANADQKSAFTSHAVRRTTMSGLPVTVVVAGAVVLIGTSRRVGGVDDAAANVVSRTMGRPYG